jgi:hypothetical protein
LEEYQRFMKNYPESEHLYETKLRTDVLKRMGEACCLAGFPWDNPRGSVYIA